MKKLLDALNKRAGRIIPAIALVLSASIAFLYALEYFDFTFVKRPDGAVGTEDVVTETPADTEPSDKEDKPEETDPPSKEPPKAEEPSIKDHEDEVQIDPSKFLDVSAADAEGYRLTTDVYTSDMIIAELRMSFGEANTFYSALDAEGNPTRFRYWHKPMVEKRTETSEGKFKWDTSAEAIPTIEAYMGYIFVDPGVGYNLKVYNAYGRLLGEFNPYAYEFAYKRDEAGRPLVRRVYEKDIFNKDRTEYTTVEEFDYFYINRNVWSIDQANYSDYVFDRGLMADYPSYYGITDSVLERNCVFNRVLQTVPQGWLESFYRTRWKFTRYGEPIDDKIYYAAFPFSEGAACVTDEEGTMFFIDENGNKLFETKKIYDYAVPGTEPRTVVETLYLPLDESTAIGCYYYEYGLVMARRQIYDQVRKDEYDVMDVISDDYVILDKTGKEFSVPVGYRVHSYSDGVILLERNGVYGYLDYTKTWLTVPEFEDAKPFMEGLAACKKDGKWGMIDTAGNTVIPFLYDNIQSVSSGVIVCHSETGWNTYLKMAK